MVDSTYSVNCQACGAEHFREELKTVKFAGFDSPLTVCDSCVQKSAEDSFKDASDLINVIDEIAKSSNDPEIRLEAIKSLLGE